MNYGGHRNDALSMHSGESVSHFQQRTVEFIEDGFIVELYAFKFSNN